MRKLIHFFIIVSSIITGVLVSQWMLAQNKKELLKTQRDEITAKIKETKAMIADSEKKQRLTSNQIAMLNEQIRYRE